MVPDQLKDTELPKNTSCVFERLKESSLLFKQVLDQTQAGHWLAAFGSFASGVAALKDIAKCQA